MSERPPHLKKVEDTTATPTMEVEDEEEFGAKVKEASNPFKLTKREREVYKELCGHKVDGFPEVAFTEQCRNTEKFPLKIALMAVVKKWAAQRSKEESKKRNQKPRQPTAYNLFFKQQMQRPHIKKLEHSERMKAVAAAWKRLSEHQKRALADQAKAGQGQ